MTNYDYAVEPATHERAPQQIVVEAQPLTASEVAALHQRAIIVGLHPAERPPTLDPGELDEAIAAQREARRKAGAAWQALTEETATMDLAAAVFERQSVLAHDRAVAAQGVHSSSLSDLWRLESQRDG